MFDVRVDSNSKKENGLQAVVGLLSRKSGKREEGSFCEREERGV